MKFTTNPSHSDRFSRISSLHATTGTNADGRVYPISLRRPAALGRLEDSAVENKGREGLLWVEIPGSFDGAQLL